MTPLIFTLLFACVLGAAHAQPYPMQPLPPNPMLCDPEKGLCEIPGATTAPVPMAEKPVRIVYFTDPICSSCWGIEPQLRRLKLEYGDVLEIEYHMGGLLPSWDVYNSGGISKPSDVAHHWDEVSAYYHMPIDGDVWLEDPLPSSYPPSIAFKAAQMQDEGKAGKFLRRIREMVFLEKKNITRWEHLQQAALEVGLDTARLRQDYSGPAVQLFEQDLMLARGMGVRSFPTLFFTDTAHNQVVVLGFKPYAAFEQAVRKLAPGAHIQAYGTDWQNLFQHYPTLTTQEFAVLTNLPASEAERQLQNLVEQQLIFRMDSKNGPLWQKNPRK